MGAGLGLRERDPLVELDGGVVVHFTEVVEHAAVPVVGVLVEAEVADHDRVVAELGRSAAIDC